MIEPAADSSGCRCADQPPGQSSQVFTVAAADAGMRLDHYLVRRLARFSRSALARLIRSGHVRVGGDRVKAGCRLRAGDQVTVCLPEPEPAGLIPEPVSFEILHEDNALLVIVKPAGVVVHPGAGHSGGTLVHGLLHHCDHLPGSDPVRPGIVHRLDKETSGIMVIAKTEAALRTLAAQFKNRGVRKRYHAILLRCPDRESGRLAAPISRHPVHRRKMAVAARGGRHAATTWKVVERFAGGPCLVEVGIETGRTHQIRVHMAFLGTPVMGDPLYGGHPERYGELGVRRQMLHASSLAFTHPESGAPLHFTAPLPPDMLQVLATLRAGA